MDDLLNTISRFVDILGLDIQDLDPTMNTSKGQQMRQLISDVSGLPLEEVLQGTGKLIAQYKRSQAS